MRNMTWFQYVISDPAGMHARSAGAISRMVEPFQSQVRIRLKTKEADASKVMALMGLKAKCGDRIEKGVEGPAEPAAARRLSGAGSRPNFAGIDPHNFANGQKNLKCLCCVCSHVDFRCGQT